MPDPIGKPTANAELLDRALIHSTFVERVKAGEVRRMRAFIEGKVIPDLGRRLAARLGRIDERGYRLGPATTQRIRELLGDFEVTAKSLFLATTNELNGDLEEMALREARWQTNSVRQTLGPIDIGYRTPAPRLILAAVKNVPMNGLIDIRRDDTKTFRHWFSEVETTTLRQVDQQIRLGIVEGDSTSKIMSRIRGKTGVLGRTARDMRTVVRTSINQITTQAREESYIANEDLIEAVLYVATLDLRTTEICISYDGDVYPVNVGPRPPQHPNCRSTTSIVLKSWKELGIDLAEAPDGTRASMDGKVPKSKEYFDWLKGKSAADQNVVLGKRKGEAFRAGKITDKKQLVDQSGRPLTIAALEESGIL